MNNRVDQKLIFITPTGKELPVPEPEYYKLRSHTAKEVVNKLADEYGLDCYYQETTIVSCDNLE